MSSTQNPLWKALSGCIVRAGQAAEVGQSLELAWKLEYGKPWAVLDGGWSAPLRGYLEIQDGQETRRVAVVQQLGLLVAFEVLHRRLARVLCQELLDQQPTPEWVVWDDVECEFCASSDTPSKLRSWVESLPEPLTQEWLGCVVEGHRIVRLHSEGSTSWVFEAVSLEASPQTRAAVKVAKPAGLASPWLPHSGNTGRATLAGNFDTGCSTTWSPQVWMARQVERLRQADSPWLVHWLAGSGRDGYVVLEWLPGPTLRQCMEAGPIDVSIWIGLIEACQQWKNSPFGFHGDLKPENVVLTPRGPRAIDPGIFELPDFCLTTPAYYPTCSPDDFLALGLMMWESAYGAHPLGSDQVRNSRTVGVDLAQWVEQQRVRGNRHCEAFLSLASPVEGAGALPSALSDMLLKALRLKAISGASGLERGEGFTLASDWLTAVESLRGMGIGAF